MTLAQNNVFYTPERILDECSQMLETPRGRLLIASCRSGNQLAGKVIAQRARQSTQNRRLPQKSLDFLALLLKHLIEQIFAHVAIFAGKIGDKAGGAPGC